MIFINFRRKLHIVLSDFSIALFIQIIFEILCYPFLTLFWAGWNRFGRQIPFPEIKKTVRERQEEGRAVICLHDWLGYPGERVKTLRGGYSFHCGRKKIIQEIKSCRNTIDSEIIVSLSGEGEMEFDPMAVDKVLKVDNRGQDFRGYSSMLREIMKTSGNPYVILMNSSVAGGFYDGWLDDYCSILANDRSIGLLGISTRARYPGLLKNHFTPHLQSFFLISTKEILSSVLDKNNGLLPGANEKNKYRLIQKGEVGLSKQVLQKGYTLAVVHRGKKYTFRLRNRFSNSIQDWPFPLEDIRITPENAMFANSLSKLNRNT